MFFVPMGIKAKLKRFPVITTALIASNAFVHLYLLTLDNRELLKAVLRYGWVVSEMNLTGLIGSQFIHVDFWHLFSNMIFLWTFGSYLETVVGPRKFLAYYLLGDFFGVCLHTAWALNFGPPENLGIPSIGASASISGLMGAHLVRCYHTKVKIGVGFLGGLAYWPKRIGVPSVLILAYYLFGDIMGALSTFDNPAIRVGHWAHLGGFFWGVAATLRDKEYLEAKKDQLRERADFWLEKGVGFDQVRKDLRKLLCADPGNAEAYLDLARIETRYELTPRGASLYRMAIRCYWQEGERGRAAMTFAEFLRRYPALSLQEAPPMLCRELIRIGEYDVAARALEGYIQVLKKKPLLADSRKLEQAYLTLAKLLADRLRAPQAAEEWLQEYLVRFPTGAYCDVARQRLAALARPAAA
ncbi:MAG: hypothetical protein A2V67_06275 [Deltaproteobacteria bacterium RBG_13_61_14]|nr:MAG: hypothetical protein A2V67_06275 [Deltaproteobacteria bacterium RBG_13_61_14]